MEGFDKSSKNLVALGLSVIVSLISTGNGGGFFYIPLFTDYLLLSIQEASALTSSTLMLGGIPAVCDAIFEKNPLMKDLPLIDFMTVLVVCPGLMFGTSVGVLVSSIVPSYVLILLTGVVFTWGCRSVLFSLVKSYKLDILRIRSSVTLSNPAVITINTGVAVSNASSIHEKGFRQPFLIQILLSIFVAIFIIFEILKSRYQINTLKFLLIQVGQCIFCISFTVAAIRIESRVRQLAIKINDLQLNMLWKQNTIVPFVAPLTQENSDAISIAWSFTRVLFYAGGFLIAGVVAGMLGLGGSFITVPILLSLGLHPEVTAGTGKVLLLISTACSSTTFALAGRIPLYPFLSYGLINLIITPVGIYMSSYIIRKTKLSSFFVLLTFLRYSIGTIIFIVIDVTNTVNELAHTPD